jgi:hypothetical protein
MFINVKTKFGVHHRNLLLVYLLIAIVLLFSSLLVSMFSSNVSPFALGTPDKVVVNNEADLNNAVNNAVGTTTIVLDEDITLTGTLYIISNKDIILTSNRPSGFYKLIGTNDGSTIEVTGKLRLDGIIVTCAKDTYCWGVLVGIDGTLVLSNGEIIDNNAGGVTNYGSFEMFGGKISNNTANYSGGGVFVASSGSFSMFGGEITNNTATDYGGGVCVSSSAIIFSSDIFNGSFMMYGGTISGNTAREGGGVYNVGTFNKQGGVISGNIGGEVYISDGNHGSSGIIADYLNGNNCLSDGNEGTTERNNGSDAGASFSLAESMIICTSIVGVVGGLFLYYKKKGKGRSKKLVDA